MLRNILLVTFRSFLRQRFYSAINVIGLSTGLACVLLIFLWVTDELNKDQFHRDADRTFRIVSNLELKPGEVVTWTITPGPLADDIRDNIAGVEVTARTQLASGILFQYEDKAFSERGFYADPDFFNIFDYPVVAGSTHPIGTDKASVAISQSLAQRLFGDANPIGKVIKVSQKYDVEVKTVLADVGANSSLRFEFILPFEIFKEIRGDGFNWGNFDHPLYVKLTDKNAADEIGERINTRRKEQDANNPDGGAPVTYQLQALKDMYLHSKFENGKSVGGRIQYVKLFSVVGIFILVVACINFMNMATARATIRAKEVGVRKVIGAQRPSLIRQFLLESISLSSVSMVLALLMVFLFLPLFNVLVSKSLTLNLLDPSLLLPVLLIVLVSGILAGSYPAFFLSAYNPVSVLKGSSASMLTGSSLRKVLVTFQFSLTVILGASALIVYQQAAYIQSKDVGYNRNSVIAFSARAGISSKSEAFRTEAVQLPGIQLVSFSDNSLVQVNNQNGSVGWPGKDDKEPILFRTVQVGYDFLETMELKLLDGRYFSRQFADTNNLVVTRRAVEVMGLQNPVGQKIFQWGTEGTIVGVVDDFHSRSLQQAIDPVIFLLQPQRAWQVFVRYDATQTQQVVAELTALYKKYNPDFPFQFTFLDEDFERLYNNERVISSLAFLFTGMTIIIAGFGLLGLAAYTVERRKKEVAIRKVLGASAATIVSLMSTDFLRLSFIASLIGCPIAYYAMQSFLKDYYYRIELGWPVFLLTGFVVMLVSILIVNAQVLKAAVVNPADSLRSE